MPMQSMEPVIFLLFICLYPAYQLKTALFNVKAVIKLSQSKDGAFKTVTPLVLYLQQENVYFL
mgnify:CR=1 FL=1